ncbi:glycosyltransferase family 2 protein [Castellaniella hirudinis]|uniref:Glycosyltransferase family 2 protein n=1 Tax=Castellaniella hirudinis TaxID=1144617 RepID=A0ABV8RZP1_9BURK
MLKNSSAQFEAERGQFARALAFTSASPDGKPEIWQPWACFKLVMYETAASLDVDPRDPGCAERQLLPLVVSRAAVGRHASARQLLDAAPWDGLPDSLRIATARYLSIYMPQEAYRLLDGLGGRVPPAAHLSISLHAGRKEQARHFLREALRQETGQGDSRLSLYRTITETLSPRQQLDCLNQVYAAQGLPGLALRCDDVPLNPCNVCAVDSGALIDGPLVSVLMTTFNVAGRVPAAIESILRQNYRHLELIVVDDCSTDDTALEVARLARSDERIRLLRLDRNVGTYCAKSVGLQHARGTFVTCMDADDWSHPLKLALQIKPLLEDDSLVASTSNCVRISDSGVVDARQGVHLEHLNYSSLLFRREKILAEIGGWDVCARTAADTELIWRINLAYGNQAIRNVPGILSLVSHRDDSLTMADDGTGFVGDCFPREILRYIEAFNRWHIDALRSCRLPRVDDDLVSWVNHHPFIFPSSAFSDVRDVADVLRNFRDA